MTGIPNLISKDKEENNIVKTTWNSGQMLLLLLMMIFQIEQGIIGIPDILKWVWDRIPSMQGPH
jgi:hypothetical protein